MDWLSHCTKQANGNKNKWREGESTPKVSAVYYLKCPVFDNNKMIRQEKKQQSELLTQGGNQASETACERAQMLNLKQ